MKKKAAYLFIACCLLVTKFYGQQPIMVSYQKSTANDSLLVNATIAAGTKAGTLMLVAKTSVDYKSDTLFLPIIDSSSYFLLLVPEEYRTGYLQLKAFFYPQVFKVTGKVLDKIKNKNINALVMIAGNQSIYNKELQLADDNSFALPSLVFDTKASLMFKYTESETKDHPEVMIRQSPIASDFTTPLSIDTIALQVSAAALNNGVATKAALPDFSKIPSTDSSDKFKMLNSVVVVGKKKSNAEKFNDQYVSPLFQDINERVIDVMDDPSARSGADFINYIQRYLPVRAGADKYGITALYWRGIQTKVFFIDEISVDINQLISINLADIAIIKGFPPPYTLARNGNGGAIAIYTKRGEFKTPDTIDNKWLYSLKGYSPAIHTLFSSN